jgi:hypothetical protein
LTENLLYAGSANRRQRVIPAVGPSAVPDERRRSKVMNRLSVPPGNALRRPWRSAAMPADPVRCHQACEAAYCRSLNCRPARIADDSIKAPWPI